MIKLNFAQDKVSVDSSKCVCIDAKSDIVHLRNDGEAGKPLIVELNVH